MARDGRYPRLWAIRLTVRFPISYFPDVAFASARFSFLLGYQSMARSQWGSKLGFILAAAGSAIGLGAVWKFPYVTATNGGGAFLFIYLLICLTFGLVLMVSEMSLGRLSHASSVGAFRQNGGKAWALVGYSGVLICFLILSFYSVVGGWTVSYLVNSATGSLLAHQTDAKAYGEMFGNFIAHPIKPVIYHGAFALLTLGVVIGGVQKGIENLSKFLMPGLFVLLLILIARALTLNGAIDGLLYFVTPDFSKVTISTVVDAMGLAFFSLSLGMGIMVTYGSYVNKEANLFSSTLWVIALTIMTCFLSGLMVLPAVFAFGFNPSAGPGLTFITMPAVFAHMPLGGLFATLFFALLLVAALTSSVSLLEVVVSFMIDEFKTSRRSASILVTTLIFLLGIPSSLSFGIWSDFTLFGMGVFDLLDYATSNLLMPLNEIFLAVFVGWVIWPKLEADLSANGHAPAILPLMKIFLRFVVPLLIGVILIQKNFF